MEARSNLDLVTFMTSRFKLAAFGLAFALTSAAQAAYATPTPSPTPPQQQGLQLPSDTSAAIVAQQVTRQINDLFTATVRAIDEGIPAQAGQPAMTAKQIQDALGADNVARIRAANKALNESHSTTSDSPKPKPKS